MFRAQRFGFGDCKPGHVALGNTPEGGHRVPLRGYGAVFEERQVRRDRVGHESALFAGDDCQALFHGGEPVHQVIGDDAAFQLPRRRHHVFVRAAAACGDMGEDRLEAALGEPGGQVDVVRAQVLHDPDVGDARREGTLPACGNLVNLTELASFNPLPQRLQRRIEPLDVPTAPTRFLASKASTRRWPAAALSAIGFSTRVWTPASARARPTSSCIRRGDGGDRHVQALGNELLHRGQHRQARRRRRADRHRRPPQPPDRRRAAREEPGHGAGPSSPARSGRRADSPSQAPAFATALTAATIRSRSSWLRDG